MKTRRLLMMLFGVVAVATGVCVVAPSYWRQTHPVFTETAKLFGALDAYSRDQQVRGHPVPPFVSLSELISRGYLATNDVRAFEGMDVTFQLAVDDSRPRNVLIRVRWPDGTAFEALEDGSVQQVAR